MTKQGRENLTVMSLMVAVIIIGAVMAVGIKGDETNCIETEDGEYVVESNLTTQESYSPSSIKKWDRPCGSPAVRVKK